MLNKTNEFQFIIVIVLVVIIFSIFISIGFIKYYKYKLEKKYIFEDKKYLEYIDKEKMNNTNLNVEIQKIKHDLKNQLIIMRDYCNEGRYDELNLYLQTMLEDPYLSLKFHTSSVVINAILNYKVNLYNKIKFDVQSNFDDINISDHDLAILLGNVLDNAIEATIKCAPEKRRIILRIKKSEQFISIYCENPYNDILEKRGDIFITQKKDKQNHGFGFESIKKIIYKYDGKYNIDSTGNDFRLSIVLYNNRND